MQLLLFVSLSRTAEGDRLLVNVVPKSCRLGMVDAEGTECTIRYINLGA